MPWRRIAILILVGIPAGTFAQNISLGVVAGTNLTDDFQAGSTTFSGVSLPSGETWSQTFVVAPGARRLIIGPKVELSLPRNWAIEADALHRELRSTTTTLLSPGLELPDGRRLTMFGPSAQTHTNWEFPVMAKYRVPVSRLRPFVALGPSFRPAGTGSGLSHYGATAGAGLEVHLRSVRLTPSLRYTRWSTANQSAFGVAIPNQVEFLVGLDRVSSSPGLSAFGRRISVGALAGLGLGRDFRPETGISFLEVPESNSPIIGASVEVGLPKNLALEVDGVYRALHGTDIPVDGSPEDRRVRFATLTWEFPVLLKYRFGVSRVRPFVEMGPSFRAIGNVEITPPSHYGVTAGGGLEMRLGRIRVSPVLRYSRWAGRQSSPFRAHTFQNQTQVLVGISYR